ncbi:MAG: acetyl-CoA carboxylase biotin carboxyl carrier protein [Alphaproteobacteria bacterium]|nr:acetyl-CoA carboxylase biotin carboxyl carrier protein [Alphaproteobacteria bacterium]
MSFDPKTVRALAEILADTGLTEIEIETKEGKVRVARTPAPITQHVSTAMHAPAPMQASAPVAAPAAAAPADDAKHAGAVLSPMVGVAYLASEPGAAPFITVGQTVAVGQTLLLIEAMKTYNQIRAQKAGTVMRILVETGQPVEYGQPLLIVE